LASNVISAAGEAGEAQALIDELDERWPQNTIVQGSVIPTQRAQLALRAGDPVEAVDLLETARPFERQEVATVRLRGQALLAKGAAAAAVAEFEKMISLKHTFPFLPGNSTAYLWLGRAHRDNGDPTAARAAYEQFFEIMKDADEGIPVIEKARAEYATLPGAKG
jgi:tetratricopeptide (TPR) repeat protein